MSRFKRFARSMVSGYALIAANVVYTLASVPLALHYLSREEFGLWAVVTQVCNFNQVLIDLGMSGALARILIDHKDDKATHAYGTVIQTGLLVLAVQGLLIALIGGMLSYWLPQWMEVPMVHWREFRLLVIWQCAMLALAFATRIFSFVLHAHQRFDIPNYVQIGCFVFGLGALWVAFEAGWGLFSMLAATAVTTLLSGSVCWWQAWRLGLLPARGKWGRPSRATFTELFAYGTDVFLVSIGLQLITASQAPVITRTLGLEAVAVWSVATKLFTLSQQLVYRLLDFSTAAFSEMMVRGEKARLRERFQDLVILTGAASAAIGIVMGLCNRAFLSIWTDNRISWPIENDLLMACSLTIYASSRCHITLAGLTKRIGAMKYIYFAEGTCFVGLALVLSRQFGLTGVILAGILTNLMLSGLYGFRRSSKYFNIGAREMLFNWLRPPAIVALCGVFGAIPIWYLTLPLSPLPQLLVCGISLATILAFCIWQLALPANLRREGLNRLTRLRARFFATD